MTYVAKAFHLADVLCEASVPQGHERGRSSRIQLTNLLRYVLFRGQVFLFFQQRTELVQKLLDLLAFAGHLFHKPIHLDRRDFALLGQGHSVVHFNLTVSGLPENSV